MPPGKPLDPANLQRDLDYTLGGTFVHDFLLQVCPPGPGLRVLEAGCGSSKLGSWYALQGAEVFVLDIDPGVLAYARALHRLIRERSPGFAIAVTEGSIHDLEAIYGASRFDFVFSEGTTHHWPPTDPRRQGSLDQMAKVTLPGGVVCAVGSNAHCSAMVEYAEKVDHTYQGMPPRQVPLDREELRAMMGVAGLSRVQVMPLGESWEGAMLLGGWGYKL